MRSCPTRRSRSGTSDRPMTARERLEAVWAWVRRVEARIDDAIAHAGSWLRNHRPQTRRHWLWTGLGALFIAFLTLDFLTMAPPIPDYASVRVAWQPSE